MQIEVPASDVADRISILRIKITKLVSPTPSVERLDSLENAWRETYVLPLENVPEFVELSRINQELWDVEDALRACESCGDFGPTFIHLARSVYRLNDERSRVKHRLDKRLQSRFVEQKVFLHPKEP